MVSNFWVETGKIKANQGGGSKLMNFIGRHSPLSQNIWRASPGLRDNLDRLLTQKSVKLVVDDTINFLKCQPLFFFCLFDLQAVTSYDTIDSDL